MWPTKLFKQSHKLGKQLELPGKKMAKKTRHELRAYCDRTFLCASTLAVGGFFSRNCIANDATCARSLDRRIYFAGVVIYSKYSPHEPPVAPAISPVYESLLAQQSIRTLAAFVMPLFNYISFRSPFRAKISIQRNARYLPYALAENDDKLCKSNAAYFKQEISSRSSVCLRALCVLHLDAARAAGSAPAARAGVGAFHTDSQQSAIYRFNSKLADCGARGSDMIATIGKIEICFSFMT